MAKDVNGLILGMQLLEPGFEVTENSDFRIGRLSQTADSKIEADIDEVLKASELEIGKIDLEGWRRREKPVEP